MTHDLLSWLNHMDEVNAVALDIAKAFGVVPHQRLMWKLWLYGIEGRTSTRICWFLLGRTQTVLDDGVCSHSRSHTDGDPVFFSVPQAPVMGPLLFIFSYKWSSSSTQSIHISTSCCLFVVYCWIYRSIHCIVMSRQPHWYSNLDWEPTQSREPAL